MQSRDKIYLSEDANVLFFSHIYLSDIKMILWILYIVLL